MYWAVANSELPKQLIEARKIWTLSLFCVYVVLPTTTVEQKITGRREREKENNSSL